MTTEQQIIAFTREQGFASAGIVTVARSESMEVFLQWLASGNAAGMSYLQRHAALRSDPRELMPSAQSIIVVAAQYPTNRQPGSGFATYARGRDYHDVIREKLKNVALLVEDLCGPSQSRVCVDSAPILEREWAVRAGIGWIGRQGQVVSPDAGSSILLGELLVDVQLEPTARCEAQCGDCRLCVDACPCKAISDDGHVDARRCISYLTIEHAGPIPSELADKMGASLFGCDICTAICPWNNNCELFIMNELEEMPMPSARECVTMTKETFRTRFSDSAVMRSGIDRLQRNARIASDNVANIVVC